MPAHYSQPKMYKKTEMALKMLAIGETAETALELVNQKKVSKQAARNLREKWKKYSLTAPSMAKSAHSQIKRILASEPREARKYHMEGEREVVDSIQEILPSDTNILSAATMVYDRYEPVVQRSVHLNVDLMDIHPVDLARYYRQVEGSEDVVDVTPVDTR
mgnify:CR=1 FL=1